MSDAQGFRLSLTLDGPEVAWDVFVLAASNLNTILRSVDRSMSGEDRPTVTWVIESITKASPLAIELAALPATTAVKPKAVKQTVQTVAQGLRMIERRAKRPAHFSDRALGAAKALAELHDRNLTAIRVKNGSASVEVTKRLSVNVDELIGPKVSAEGTVEGTLEVVSIHGKREFSIFEALTNNRVTCHFKPEQLDAVIGAFGKRVAAHGEIFASATGKRLTVTVEELEVFPSEDELPSIDSMVGIFGETE